MITIDESKLKEVQLISGQFRLFRTTTPGGNVQYNMELKDDLNRVISFDSAFGFRIPRALGECICGRYDYLNNVEK